MSYSYNNYQNPYQRNYQMPNYNQPQYIPQQSQQPIMQPQTVNQPQIQPQMQQPVQAEMPIQYVGYATLKEAEGYILYPNAKAIFIDKANSMCYEKVCANDGQSFLTYYKKVDLNTNNQVESIKQETPFNVGDFVRKDELNGFVTIGQYEELMQMFIALKEQLNAPKQTQKARSEKIVEKENE